MYNFNIGDRLVREKGGIVTKHHAVYVGNGWVAENQVKVGVRYITVQRFLREGKLVRVERFGGNYWQRQTVLQRVESLIGESYRLLSYNCEHFVNEVLHGMPKSQQIETASLATTGVGIALAFKYPIAGAVVGGLGLFVFVCNKLFSRD